MHEGQSKSKAREKGNGGEYAQAWGQQTYLDVNLLSLFRLSVGVLCILRLLVRHVNERDNEGTEQMRRMAARVVLDVRLAARPSGRGRGVGRKLYRAGGGDEYSADVG